MSVEKIDIDNFLTLSQELPIIDVRSPGEYSHSHIPDSFHVPLFTDDQRAIIGTAYKKQNRHAAVNHGLSFFSDRMKIIPNEIETIITDHRLKGISSPYPLSENKRPGILVYCWRGGMRSGAVAWLMSLYGDKVYLLNGGYKSFRRWALSQFQEKYRLKILGGYTGSGKTELLTELKKNGEIVIGLEHLANHRGSAFGALGEIAQPSNEMFENLLAVELWKAMKQAQQSNREIWVEDESAHIGKVGIPKLFWDQMRESPLYFMDVDFEKRVDYIVKTYGIYEKQDLTDCVIRIQKRLGGLNTKNAISFLSENNFKEAFSILIKYYDKMYDDSLGNRNNLQSLLKRIKCSHVDLDNSLKVLDC
ncbi:MAG: tRNA 2-selenouridine(34) synthase MnmH [Ginsengibacter sp.]